jgi:heptosyltransferase-3
MQERIGKDAFILIHPTSRWRFKCLSVAQMRKLVAELVRQGKRVLVSSGPDPIEVAMVEDIVRGFPVENYAGKLTLKELGALIQLSSLLICVDSVPLHIASALKAPVIALFGPTSEVTWGPWRNPYARVVTQNLSCRPCYQDGCGGSKFSDCLQQLSVEKILEQMQEIGIDLDLAPQNCLVRLPGKLR